MKIHEHIYVCALEKDHAHQMTSQVSMANGSRALSASVTPVQVTAATRRKKDADRSVSPREARAALSVLLQRGGERRGRLEEEKSLVQGCSA